MNRLLIFLLTVFTLVIGVHAQTAQSGAPEPVGQTLVNAQGTNAKQSTACFKGFHWDKDLKKCVPDGTISAQATGFSTAGVPTSCPPTSGQPSDENCHPSDIEFITSAVLPYDQGKISFGARPAFGATWKTNVLNRGPLSVSAGPTFFAIPHAPISFGSRTLGNVSTWVGLMGVQLNWATHSPVSLVGSAGAGVAYLNSSHTNLGGQNLPINSVLKGVYQFDAGFDVRLTPRYSLLVGVRNLLIGSPNYESSSPGLQYHAMPYAGIKFNLPCVIGCN